MVKAFDVYKTENLTGLHKTKKHKKMMKPDSIFSIGSKAK